MHKLLKMGVKMIINKMILSNSYKSLFYQTGLPCFYMASKYAERGEILTLPQIIEQDSQLTLD